jgi:hypothetical protein
MNGRVNQAIGILRLTRDHRVQLKQEYQRPLSVAPMIRQSGLACPMAKGLNIENQYKRALICNVRISKDLGSWDQQGYQSSAEGRPAIVNYEFAKSEQFHLRRCDHYRSLGAGCQVF